jgi:type II secretory pathway pseudopilin PulG
MTRRAFTLLELLASLAITTILVLTMGSAMLIASRSIPDGTGRVEQISTATNAVEEFIDDLRVAVYVTEWTNNAVGVSVPDRNGDGVPEHIRYAWSGVAGDALTRSLNGSAPVTYAEQVDHFNLSWDLTSVTEEYPGAAIESPEHELSQRADPYHNHQQHVDSSRWTGQYLRPWIPPFATEWRITRAQFQGRRASWWGSGQAQVRTTDVNGLPTEQIIDTVDINYNGLWGNTWYWREYDFQNAGGLIPGQAACVVITGNLGILKIRRDDHTGQRLVKTTNAGTSWSHKLEQGLFHYIFGTYTTPGPPQTLVRDYLLGVNVTLETSGVDADPVTTAVRLLNMPEVLQAVWHADFELDPTTYDMNSDGHGDWTDGGGTFDPSSLVDGVWQVDSMLDTTPRNDFVEPTTIDVRFKNDSVGGLGAVVWINADWTGGRAVPLIASLMRQPDDTQTFVLYQKTDGFTWLPLLTVPDLPGDFISLHLLIDPMLDTVNVRIDAVEHGTVRYVPYASPSYNRDASLLAWGSSAQIDAITIRVGGTSGDVPANSPPTATASADLTSVDTNDEIRFDAHGSTDPDLGALNYHWDFGDGDSATGMVASHTFLTPGQFTVTLTTWDNSFAWDTDTVSIDVDEP